ncbi:MAG TPA: YlbF family regulator [Longimicrobiales bacterium]|nr:YlbF family regulator [Longimicrobiales bacterium]
MAGIYDMAKDLGAALARTDEYQALKRAMDSAADDRDLVELRNRLEQLETQIEASLRAGQEPSDEVKQEYGETVERLQLLPGYQRVVAAQANFDKVMYRVNQTMAQGIEEGAKSRIIITS